MNSQPDQAQLNIGQRPLSDADGVTETFWGYVVGPGHQQKWFANQGEGIATIVCLLFGVAAFAQWLWPGSNSDPTLVMFKLGATAVFIFIAWALYVMAKRGMTSECQIDLQKGVVRLVRTNRGGESIVHKSIAFDQIFDVLIRQPFLPFQSATLVLQTSGAEAEINLRKGSVEDLMPLGVKLRSDLKDNLPTG